MSEATTFTARHFAGPGHPGANVTLRATSSGLLLSTGAVWSYGSLRVPHRPTRGEPFTLERAHHPVEALVFPSPEILATIRKVAPAEAARFPAPSSHRRFFSGVLAGAFAAVVLLVLAYTKGVPALANAAAKKVPPEWEIKMGGAMRTALAPEGSRVDDPALAAVIDSIVTRLDAHAPPHPYRFRVTVVRRPEVNALAAPGGELVFFTGLIEKTESPEELAGVVAHEMQHVLLRHSTRGILRRASVGLILGFFIGDAGALTGLVQTAEEIGGLAYGRADELEADRAGAALLVAAGIDPSRMVRMFETLAESEADVPAALSYLSTHPATEDRIARLRREHPRPIDTRPIPTPEPWSEIVLRVQSSP
jgi:predicted Zn-dependent protease